MATPATETAPRGGTSFLASILTARGRLNRQHYWSCIGIALAGPLAILALMCAIAVTLDSKSLVWAAPMVVAGVAFLVIALFLTVRRLHDRGKSGHWLWLFYFLPAVFLRFANAANEQGQATHSFVFGALALALLVWAFVEIGCRKSTTGPNRFGPDPLAGTW
jgi:uncharacterized membrane protein YhaH (DUF805 family)